MSEQALVLGMGATLVALMVLGLELTARRRRLHEGEVALHVGIMLMIVGVVGVVWIGAEL